MANQQFNTVAELRAAIQQLEINQADQWPPLKDQLLSTVDSFKPKHIIKDIFGRIFSEPTLKATAISTTLGLAVILATNLLPPTRTASQLTKLVTGAIVGVTAIGKIVNNGSRIKSMGSSLLSVFFKQESA